MLRALGASTAHVGLAVIAEILLVVLAAPGPCPLPGHAGGIRIRRAAARLRADGLLETLGLAGRSRQLPGQLSGGEQQRVAIARALINDPAVLLADEPTASLDTQRGQAVVELLAGQIHERGTAGLLVTHDPRMAGSADRIVRLTDGGLIEAVEVT